MDKIGWLFAAVLFLLPVVMVVPIVVLGHRRDWSPPKLNRYLVAAAIVYVAVLSTLIGLPWWLAIGMIVFSVPFTWLFLQHRDRLRADILKMKEEREKRDKGKPP
jgi:hypothetical protein